MNERADWWKKEWTEETTSVRNNRWIDEWLVELEIDRMNGKLISAWAWVMGKLIIVKEVSCEWEEGLEERILKNKYGIYMKVFKDNKQLLNYSLSGVEIFMYQRRNY